MTPNELILFKEMIKEAVRDVVKEELAKHDVKKDLKEVKLLVAGMIKENRKYASAPRQVSSGGKQLEPLTEETQHGLGDILNKAQQISRTRAAASNPVVKAIANTVNQLEAPASIKNVLMETTMEMAGGGVADASDLGAGEYLTDDNWATGPVDETLTSEYGEIEEAYESKLPDFGATMKSRLGK